MDEDLYVLLGVSRNASADDIRKAYRKAALLWHPVRLFLPAPHQRTLPREEGENENTKDGIFFSLVVAFCLS